MPSKKQSITSRKNKQPEYAARFLLDRSLGRYKLAVQLTANGFAVTAGDEVYDQDARDPWIFYDCGKKGLVVVTADKDFMKSFPHMAAVSLGKTTVVAFTSNNYNSSVRGKAFIKAKRRIFSALVEARGAPFIGSVGMDGSFSVLERNPHPNRKYCDERDWKSYERACKAEGVPYEKPQPSSSEIRGGDNGPPEDQADAKTA